MIKVILWLDDVRDPNNVYYEFYDPNIKIIWCHSVNEAIAAYCLWGNDSNDNTIRLVEINLDHDAGDFVSDGGDYIKFLDWLEVHYPSDFPKINWKIHSMNPVGTQNMLAILRRNGVDC